MPPSLILTYRQPVQPSPRPLLWGKRINSLSERSELAMNPSPSFGLKLIGTPTLLREDGGLLRGPATQRHRLALLALLALAPAPGLSRDKVMAYLWPERDSEHARQLLNQAVYQLRKALGEEALLSELDDLRLNSDVIRVDVLDFEAALSRGDAQRAASLYTGPFLDGFFLSDAPEFEQWVDGERERLASAFARALEALAEAAEEAQDLPAALEWWKRRAAQDPYDSRVALRLMQVLEASGNRGGALQHAAVHGRLLQEEFGVGPSPEVRTLAEQLRSAPAVRLEPGAEQPLPPEPPRTGPEGGMGPEAHSISASPLAIPDPSPAQRQIPAVRYVVAALLAIAVIFGIGSGSREPDMPPPTAPEPSIAVLPLRNLTTDHGDAALADGMTEKLISVLGKAEGLRVIASTSVFGFRDRQLDVRSIADSLRVGNLLEGGVQRSGSRLRVQVRLVDGRDGSTRWSETYDREMQDVFAVQDEIGRAVARELGLRLGGATDASQRRQPTQSVAAYELYLRGSDRTLLRNDSTARQGLEYFRQAIALDSTYAAAWAGLGRMYGRVSSAVSRSDRVRYLALAEEAVQKALALDDSLAEAHAMLGVLRMYHFDFASAELHLTRSIKLDPTRALTHEWLVTLHLWTGTPEQALAHAERALELDPLSPTAHAELARALLGNGRCDEAIEVLDRLAGLQPPLLRVAPMAADCHARQQNWPKAVAVVRPQAELGDPTTLALLGYLLARAGEREEALRIHAEVLTRWRRGDGGALEVAVVYSGLGDIDQALTWLDRAIDDHSINGSPAHPLHLTLGPLFEDLRHDSRFERLRERLGLQKR
jgi:DNA-binding SARP family transcriptional activator/TolB-like protein